MSLHDFYIRFMVWLGAAPPIDSSQSSSSQNLSLMLSEETRTSESDKPDKELLFKEYEACRDTTKSLEVIIWQTSAAIGIGSIGAFILVTNHAEDKPVPWVVSCIIGVLVSLASWVWFLIARRWWSIQHANFLRMRHIEDEIAIYRIRYVDYLDDPNLLLKSNLSKKYKDEIIKQAAKPRYLIGLFPSHQKLGIQSVIWLIPFIITAAWGAYLLYRLIV